MKTHYILFLIGFSPILIPHVVPTSSTHEPSSIVRIPIIPKCCNIGEVLLNHKCQYVPPNLFNFTIEFYAGQFPVENRYPYEVVPNLRCEHAVSLYTGDFYLQQDGTLLIAGSTEFLNEDEYCIDVDFNENEKNSFLLALWCYNVADVLEPPVIIISLGNLCCSLFKKSHRVVIFILLQLVMQKLHKR